MTPTSSSLPLKRGAEGSIEGKELDQESSSIQIDIGNDGAVHKKRKLIQSSQDMSQQQNENKNNERRESGHVSGKDEGDSSSINSDNSTSKSHHSIEASNKLSSLNGKRQNEKDKNISKNESSVDGESSRQNEGIGNEKRQAILAQLYHRRHLLDKIKLCREVSKIRLDLISIEGENKRYQNVTGTKLANGIKENVLKRKLNLSKPPNNIVDGISKDVNEGSVQKEVEDFREMCQQALQFTAKRPLIAENNSNNSASRGSVSLRRGANVGKKMQAAVTALTSNAICTPDTSSINTQNKQPINRATSLSPIKSVCGSNDDYVSHTTVPSTPNISLQSLKDKVIIPNVALSATLIPKDITSIRSDSSMPRVTSSIPHSSDQSARKRAPSNAGSHSTTSLKTSSFKQQKTKRNHISSIHGIFPPSTHVPTNKIKRIGNNKHIHPISNVCSSSEITTSTMPLHYGLNNEADLLPMTNAHNGIPSKLGNTVRVLCPETERLRNRKRVIEFKLDAIYQREYEKQLIEKNTESLQYLSNDNATSGVPINLSYKLNDKSGILSHQQSIPDTTQIKSWKNVTKMGTTPSMLPHRTKVHWDHVLEEMRWLATDFIEERKWKIASCRSLSTELRSSSHSATSLSQCLPPLTGKALSSLTSAGTNGNSESIKVQNYASDSIKCQEEIPVSGHKESNAGKYNTVPLNVTINYQKPSSSDLKKSVTIAKILGKLVEDHWKIVGNQNHTNRSINLDRYQKLHSQLDRGNSSCADKRLRNCTSSVIEEDLENAKIKAASKDTKSAIKCDGNKGDVSNDHITKCMVSSLQLANEMRNEVESSSTQEAEPEISSDIYQKNKIRLHNGQIKPIQFVESIWKESVKYGKTISGAIISGCHGCGKTLLTAAIIWRRRVLGPQLLICQPASVIRWRTELSLLNELNVLTYGKQGWSHDYLPQAAEVLIEQPYKKCDIIVCELSSIESLFKNHISNEENHSIVSFATVCIDVRHSFIRRSSYLHGNPLKGNNNRTKKKKKKKKKKNNESALKHVENDWPSDLVSEKWWNSLLFYLSNDHSKRILIETSCALNIDEADSLDATCDDDNYWIDMLCFKFVFLHQTFFPSVRVSHGKRALIWAKAFQNYLKTNTNMKDFIMADMKLHYLKLGVKKIFLKFIRCITFEVQYSDCFRKNQKPNRDLSKQKFYLPKWKIHLCTLSQTQRNAYDRICLFVRGGISSRLSQVQFKDNAKDFNLSCTDKHISVAKALMKLRHACFHSESNNPLYFQKMRSTAVDEQSNFEHYLTQMNPSQPCLEMAKKTMDNSAKLNELFKILCEECGYDMVDEELLLSDKCVKKRIEKSSKINKNILILASLPEILLSTSDFLNSVGFAHELLMYPSHRLGRNDSDVASFQGPVSRKESIENWTMLNNSLADSLSLFSWIRCQQSLAFFEQSNKNHSLSFNIILTSPATISSSSLGLSASNADVVISVDEDWSGRGQLHVLSILKKNCTKHHNSLESRPPKFIKLISEHTCEQSFLTSSSISNRETSSIPLSMYSIKRSEADYFGNLCVSTSLNNLDRKFIDEPTVSSQFSHLHRFSGFLLGHNILRYQNTPLNTVLQMKCELPPALIEGNQYFFLPNIYNKSTPHTLMNNDVKEPLPVSNNHKQTPALIDETFDYLITIITVKSIQNAVSFGLALTLVESCSTSFTTFRHKRLPQLPNHAPPYFFPQASFLRSGLFCDHDIISIGVQNYVKKMKLANSSCKTCLTDNAMSHFTLQQNVCFPKLDVILSRGNNINATSKKCEKSSSAPKLGSEIRHTDETLASSLLVYSCFRTKKNPGISKISEVLSDTNSPNAIISKSVQVPSINKEEENYQHNSQQFPCQDLRNNLSVQPYRLTHHNQDGNQGKESLVYFPPSYPDLILSSQSLIINSSGVKANIFQNNNIHKKRKSVENLINLYHKKSRKDSPFDSPKVEIPNTSFLPLESVVSTTFPITRPTTNSDSLSLGTKFSDDLKLLEVPDHADYSSSFVSSSLISTIEMKEEVRSEKTMLENVEDFDLIDNRLLPNVQDSLMFASKETIQTNPYSFWADFLEPQYSCNSVVGNWDHNDSSSLISGTFNGPSLDSIILHVKARPRNNKLPIFDNLDISAIQQTPKCLNSPMSQPYFMHTNSAIPISHNKIPNKLGGSYLEDISEKKNQFINNLPPLSTPIKSGRKIDFKQHALLHGNMISNINRRINSFDAKTNGIFRSCSYKRTKTSSAEILASTHSTTAYLHLQRNLSDRVSMLAGKNRSNEPAKFGINLIELLSKRKITEDFAVSVANSQLVTFYEDDLIPGKVDFGPFQVGFLPRVKYFTNTLPNKTRVGVVLPMGVKMPKHPKINDTKLHSGSRTNVDEWSNEEDEYLKHCARDFGLNWRFVCHALNYLSHSNISSCRILDKHNDTESRNKTIRSARQCQERFYSLFPDYIGTTAVNDLRILNRMKDECSCSQIRSQCFKYLPYTPLQTLSLPKYIKEKISSNFEAKTSILINPLHISKTESDALSKSVHKLQQQKRLICMKKSSANRQRILLTVPDCNSGNDISTLPSHPSHSQSVQDAVNLSADASGLVPSRAEMWPLQFLDLAEKQRSAQKSVIPAVSQLLPSSQQVQPLALQTKPHGADQQHELVKQAARAAALSSANVRGKSSGS